jgi:hypothetical protein
VRGSLAKISHAISTILARSKEEEKEQSSQGLSTLIYRFVGHMIIVGPHARGKVPNTTLPLNEARSLELQSNRVSEAFLDGSNGIE